MTIDLISDATFKIKSSRVYSLSTKDKEVLDDTFDKLQIEERLNYVTEAILFEYSIFVI